MNFAESNINYQPGIQARVTKKMWKTWSCECIYNNHTKSELCWIRTCSEDTTLTVTCLPSLWPWKQVKIIRTWYEPAKFYRGYRKLRNILWQQPWKQCYDLATDSWMASSPIITKTCMPFLNLKQIFCRFATFFHKSQKQTFWSEHFLFLYFFSFPFFPQLWHGGTRQVLLTFHSWTIIINKP